MTRWHLIVLGAVVVVGLAAAGVVLFGVGKRGGMRPSLAAEGHDHPAPPATQPTGVFKGDLYLLDTDPVTGEKLGDKPIILQHEGRELRFASQANADQFKAEPAKYLPKVDEAMAQAQLPFYPLETCMVSGDKLGGDMGAPVNLIYKNRLVRFCCPSCLPDFNKDPGKYIAKLDAAVIAKQKPGYPLSTCPVSGAKLGGEIGPPLDVVVGNRLVRFCCDSCPPDFNANPAKYLAKIDAAANAKNKPATGK